MKKMLSIALAIILVFSGLTPIHAETSSTPLYNEAGNILYDLGLLRGNSSGNLNLEGNLKRQDMVVMISRLYKDEDNAKNYVVQPGQNKFKDLTVKQKDYIPYITWAVQKDLIKGKKVDEFGFGEDVSIQQYQTVLLRALGYNKDADDWEMVPAMASKYHIMENLSGVNPSSKLTRGQMSLMTVNALRQEKNGRNITLAQELGVTIPEQFKVDAVVKVDNNSLIFEGQAKGTSNLWVSLKPISSDITAVEILKPVTMDYEGNFSFKIENLQVGNYHYKFQSGTKNTTPQAVSIDVLPFNLVDVKASNLKEITLTYTQAVDRTIASLVSNYSTTAGSIKNVRIEGNDTKVILTLNGIMVQQGKYKVSALKTKSASGVESLLKDYEFEAFDNQFPTIVSVEQLGSKGLKLHLSEPVKSAVPNNFKIDGKAFSGNVTLENNVITLLHYSYYALSEGNHTILISGLEDYVGNKIVDENISFTISKDSKAPTIVNSTATLDEVIIEFSEDIDPISAINNNFYWRAGAIKRYPNKVTFEGNKAIVEFTNHNLSINENTIYVENVMDFSNNRMKASEIKVVPLIDMSAPEVTNYQISEDGKAITVYFSKNVNGNTKANYSIVDKDYRTVLIRDIQGSGKEFRIQLHSPLPVGLLTLTIQGIQDTTPYKHLSIPFTSVIDMKDVEKPKIISNTGFANNIIIYFSKPMNMATVSNPENYVMSFGGRLHRLPIDTIFTPGNDGRSVTIYLPENFDGKKIMVGTVSNLTSLDIRGLKDINDNDTDPLIVSLTFDGSQSGKATAIDYYSDRPGKQGVLLESDIIKVRFNVPIIQANITDFIVPGRMVTNVVADGTNEVTIYLNEDNGYYPQPTTLNIMHYNNLKTSIDTSVEPSVVSLYDVIPPRVRNNTSTLVVNGTQIELPFTEALEEEGVSLYRRDLEIYRLVDGKVLNKDDYSTFLKQADKSILIISINKRDITSGYSIRLSGESSTGDLTYIRDLDRNLALPSDIYYTLTDIVK